MVRVTVGTVWATGHTCTAYIRRSHGSASVVRATMKVNGRWGNLTPATQKPLSRWSPKFVYVTKSAISTTMQNFIQIGLVVSVLRMRDFAPLVTRLLFLGSWERLQPRRVHRFWRKIRQMTRFRARKCLLGVAKPKSKVSTPIFPQNHHFWAQFLTFAWKRL